MTILEVLFAMMVASVGLLGAISIFPVASAYARKGRLNDEIAAGADAATHTFDAQHMRRPDRWIRYAYNSGTGFYTQFAGPSAFIVGESYCIDPRFYSQNLVPNPNAPPNNLPTPIPSDPQATVFPSFPQQLVPPPPWYVYPPAIGPPRMTRLTLWNNRDVVPNMIPMGRFQANLTMSCEDELAYERPGVQKGELVRNDNAQPAHQLYSPILDVNSGTIYPGRREEEGKLSWLATLVPKIDQETGLPDDKYLLSTVFFYARSPDLVYNAAGPFNEWTAVILGRSLANPLVSDFHSQGYGGGEVTITAHTADQLRMKAGDWVMLGAYVPGPLDSSGPLPLQPPLRTVRKTFKWYRITEADEEPRAVLVSGVPFYQRDVTLVGPDWALVDVTPLVPNPITGNHNSVPDNFSDDVEVIIVPNVVAVYDRTIRLELDGSAF